jgi:nicotinic acid mononucleotide adenylyltransferase
VFDRGENPYDLLKKKEFLKGMKLKALDFVHIPISSSYIRERLKKGKGVRYLLYEEVLDYIKEKKLYGE